MAEWDLADLLARAKRLAQRPAQDEQQADADWYAFLSEAQADYMKLFATHVPESQYQAPEMMVTGDNGQTYYFKALPPAQVFPLGHVELRFSRTGRLLRDGPEFD